MKRRSESNFGLHFDFHADGKTENLGANFRPDEVEYMISEVRPDFVQCDTKGHPGYASYFSELGNTDPNLKTDLLAEWRKITEKYGVALLSHYSGVWDHKASEDHEDWRQIDENGNWTNENSVFSEYAEKLLIPQLKELASRGMNGAWVDAECWGVKPDFSITALNEYKKRTGKTPEKTGESFEEYKNFCRRGFLDYVKKYVDAVHAAYPDFEIASNWLYTSFCPERPDIDVDFISGDYDAADSLNTARFEARCLPAQGKPWDLMAWAFNIQNGFFVNKSAIQLKQEIAVPLSLGGGVQVYNIERGGNIQKWIVPVLKELAVFAREHRCLHKADVVPQVGVIFSNAGFYHNKKWLFSKYDDRNVAETTGLTLAVADAGYGVDVLFTHNALAHMDSYPVIVLPDWPEIEAEMRDRLLEFVTNGGKLLAVGTNVFGALNIDIDAGEEREGVIYAEQNGFMCGIDTVRRKCSGDRRMGAYYTDSFKESEAQPWCVIKAFGKGEIYFVPFKLGEQYRQNYSFVLTDMMRAILERAFSCPVARVLSRHKIDLSVMRKDGNTYVTLLNRSGDHENGKVRAFDTIPPLYNVTVQVNDCATSAKVLETGEIISAVKSDGKNILILNKLDTFATLIL